MGRDTRHVSEEEKKKGLVIVILVGILIAIALMIVILMIPKGKKDETQPVELSSKVASPTGNQGTRDDNNTNKTSRHSTNSTTSPKDLDIIAKDKTKVTLEIKPGSLTVDGAVIVITDNNVSHYTWTPIYKLQQKVDGQWQDLELKNPENAIFPEINYNNTTGVMEQSLIWSNKYGQLEKGSYRIVKEAGGLEFYAEFDVQ